MARAGELTLQAMSSQPLPAARQRLWLCVLAVVALHATLLATLQPPTDWSTVSAGHGQAPSVAVHLLRDDSTPAPPEAPASPEPGQATGETLRHAVLPAPPASAPAASGAQIVEVIEPPGVTATGASVEGLADPDLYLPRSALTQGASAIGTIRIDYPPEAPAGQYSAELTLFIDDAGTVRRVRIDRSDAPPPLQDAALQAFQNARFLPGELYGRPVRSRMRVEVEFSAETLAPLAETAASAASATP